MMEQTQGDPFFWSAATTETTETTVVATPARRRDILAVISLVAGLWLGYVAMALIVLAGAAYMLIVIVRSSAL